MQRTKSVLRDIIVGFGATALAFGLITNSAIAMPNFPTIAAQDNTAVTPASFFGYSGGCFVYYQTTRLKLNGRIGPPGYERNEASEYFCFFSI